MNGPREESHGVEDISSILSSNENSALNNTEDKTDLSEDSILHPHQNEEPTFTSFKGKNSHLSIVHEVPERGSGSTISYRSNSQGDVLDGLTHTIKLTDTDHSHISPHQVNVYVQEIQPDYPNQNNTTNLFPKPMESVQEEDSSQSMGTHPFPLIQ